MKTYPRLEEIGVKIHEDKSLDYVCWTDLKKALKGKGWAKQFGEYFGSQTCYVDGPYAHDVEAVLERIESGRLTGTQKYWD